MISIYNQVIERAENCYSYMVMLLETGSSLPVTFSIPHAESVLLQIALARESDAELEELRNLQW
jgi:hypothetical protein